ncbi:hypothetical protein [Luteimonas panaciterrae]|uniref:hypothetical protein n=1 Tax=Luteimonas panaciterrae TaxID=363885 RepID=UPI001CFAA6FB|nr:hypothetical protein [Luteimonas panaciterrae]
MQHIFVAASRRLARSLFVRSSNRFFNLKPVDIAPIKELGAPALNGNLGCHAASTSISNASIKPLTKPHRISVMACAILGIDGHNTSPKHNRWRATKRVAMTRPRIAHGSATPAPVAITAPLL